MTDDEANSDRTGEGARVKQKITEDKQDVKQEPFDPGASMLGTDDEAGSPTDQDEMAQARRAPPPP